MAHSIKKLVLRSLFEQAYCLIEGHSIEEKWEIICNELYRIDPHRVYSFLRYLVVREESCAEWEYYSFVYLVYCNPFFDDAMRLAAWHLRRAIEMDRKNIEYAKQAVSVFYSYPVQYFSDNEFFEIATEIIRCDNKNLPARTVLEQLSNTGDG